MKIIDVKGKKCPMPLIETKKALKEIGRNEALKVITDSANAVKNVTHYLEDNGIPVHTVQSGNVWEININKGDNDLENTTPEAYCPTSEEMDKSFVVVYAKDRLGEGSEELGNALVGAMLNTMKEMDTLPQKIIFINSGINLVIKSSLVISQLKVLESKGVELISCGTCLDYYGKMDELAVGRISNMLEIMESMTNVGKVINV
jgi:selenium metabolism protein YedF